jgi:hypothetical protein
MYRTTYPQSCAKRGDHQMKPVSEKNRMLFAIYTACLFSFALHGCGSKKVDVPLEYLESYDGGGVDDEEQAGGSGGAGGSSSKKSGSNACLDNLASQRKDAKLSRTVKCEQCLCDKCADQVNAVIEAGSKAIDVVTCAEKNKVTGQCLLCKGNCMSTFALFQGPCVDQVCKASSVSCSTANTLMDFQLALSVNTACTAGEENPCGYAMALSECLLNNCPSDVCSSNVPCE